MIEGVVFETDELFIETADEGTVQVGLGPSAYREAQGFVLQVGENVRVSGYWEDDEFKAVQLENLSTGQSIVLSEEARKNLRIELAPAAIRDIHEVLEMTIEEARDFFDAVPALKRKLQTLMDVGLSYVKLGQAATTLSGGETIYYAQGDVNTVAGGGTPTATRRLVSRASARPMEPRTGARPARSPTPTATNITAARGVR